VRYYLPLISGGTSEYYCSDRKAVQINETEG
jgi:hypothetical protein